MGAPEFPTYAPDTAGFYDTLRKRVKGYFDATKQDPKNAAPGILRMIPVFALFVACFLVQNGLLLQGASFGLKAAAAAVFGVCQVLPLLHVMHDASHAAIGSSEGGWKLWGRLTLDWMAGCSMMQWHHQHIVGHHQYTNIYLSDPDIPFAPGDPRFFVSGQAWAAVYKWQHLYLPVLYSLLAFKVRFEDINSLWVQGMSGPVRVNLYSNPWVRLALTKAVWAAWRIGVPLLVLGVPQSTFWACFLIAELVSGAWLAWNFEVRRGVCGRALGAGCRVTAPLHPATLPAPPSPCRSRTSRRAWSGPTTPSPRTAPSPTAGPSRRSRPPSTTRTATPS